jgi:hypothetical protein
LNLISDVITSAAPFFFTAGLLMFLAMPLWLVGQKKSGNKKLLIFIAAVLFIIAGDKKQKNKDQLKSKTLKESKLFNSSKNY